MREPAKLAPFTGTCDGLAGFAVCGTAPFGLALLVPKLFAFGEGQLNFYPPILEVQARGNEGEPFLLRLADELAKLFFMDEQFTGTQRSVVEDVAVVVRTNMAVQQPEFSILEQPIRVFEVGASCSYRFDLCPGKGDTGFKFL